MLLAASHCQVGEHLDGPIDQTALNANGCSILNTSVVRIQVRLNGWAVMNYKWANTWTLNTCWSQRNLVMHSLIGVWSTESIWQRIEENKKKNLISWNRKHYKRNEQEKRKKRHKGFRRFLCGFLTLNINRCSCSTCIWNSPNNRINFVFIF